MKKQFSIIPIILFSISLILIAENRFSAPTRKPKPLTQQDSTLNSKVYSPEELGMNSKTLTRIDSVVNDAMRNKVFPGCQVFVLKNGKTVLDKNYGTYAYESSQKVTSNTMYDLASLSKTTGTLLAIMKLYDTGKLKLSDKASTYLSFLRATNKEDITIKDLLFHETGLLGSMMFYNSLLESLNSAPQEAADESVQSVQLKSKYKRYKNGWTSTTENSNYKIHVADNFYIHNRFHEMAMQKIANARLGSKTYLYSCVNFILLKEIAESISGQSMDEYLDKEFYAPMQLKNLLYLPLRTHLKEQIAPTLSNDFLRGGILKGYVHDPDAAFLGGVSGNAGLFATAHDVALVYQILLNQGELNGIRYLSPETVQLFTTTESASGRRGLGFDKPVPSNPRINPCSSLAPQSVYGHTGYTGTCCWVDPTNKLVYVFLSNRTYPNDGVNKLARMSIRPKIQEIIYKSLK